MSAAMVSALDDSVGRVFGALRERRVLEDSVFLFCSSSGGDAFEPAAGSNWPLRGSKGSLWEGGTRTPALLWSAKVTAPRVATQLMHIADWLPTLYSAAGMYISLDSFGNLRCLDAHEFENHDLRNSDLSAAL
ncbi:hypothetical protein HPB48_000202 [Haemaphysalis longicornis]|uniref:Sulfatase N-terminal domain-containing protein n=1 Tax=Haemaphysalis longicornis TaxID=44386 RepID=A0A9J6GJ07_HAELO|nr:hypothetical protein HPB48_000202 [Haemaphysalis longicornis]